MKFKNKEEVHNRAEKIKNIPIKILVQQLGIKSKGNKNIIGDVFEEWFGKRKDNESKPDLGVSELKATPFKKYQKKFKGNYYGAKERLVLNIINYNKLDKETFENSHFLSKNKVLELAFYEYIRGVDKGDLFFKYIAMYQMSLDKAEYAQIKRDWNTIHEYIRKGKAEDLSESATKYLAACTKGKNKDSLRTQPNSSVKAKQRAFSFKQGFMTDLLNNKVIRENKEDKSIISDPIEVEQLGIDGIIENKLNKFVDMSTANIAIKVGLKFEGKSPKNKNNMLIRMMLGLNGNNKELDDIRDLKKASIIPKTIQINYDGKFPESMNILDFKFKDLASEYWEDDDGIPESKLNNLLSENEFLFLVFKRNKKNENTFIGYKLFSFSNEEINGPIKSAFLDTKEKLNNGVLLRTSGKRTFNNLVSASDNKIIHVRPHALHSSYINNSDSDILPTPAYWKDGKTTSYITKQAFWINKNFIKKIIEPILNKSKKDYSI